MNEVKEMIYVGHNHFSSKEKDRIYSIIQVLYNVEDKQHFTNKATLINIFVDDEIYKKVAQSFEVGNVIKIEIVPNISTGKINYNIVGV